MKASVYDRVTATIIEALEKGASGKDWELPWRKIGLGAQPHNVLTQKSYRGMNFVLLAVSGYPSPVWGTYKQWQSIDAQVRKGERGTLCVKWSEVEDKKAKPDANGKVKKVLVPFAFTVFNSAQVDGWEPDTKPLPDLTERLAAVDADISALGVDIRDGGTRAFYSPALDIVGMPARKLFKNTKASSATENYYSTLLHETVHWTGHESRLNRPASCSKNTEEYAFEELIAELGAAFLCAHYGVSSDGSVRPDHAQYIASWLGRLKSDSRAIFSAASKAQKAADFVVNKTK